MCILQVLNRKNRGEAPVNNKLIKRIPTIKTGWWRSAQEVKALTNKCHMEIYVLLLGKHSGKVR